MTVKRHEYISLQEVAIPINSDHDIQINWKSYIALSLTVAMLIVVPLGTGMRHGLLWGAIAGLGIWSIVCAIVFVCACIRGRQMDEELFS